ncbi:MAG: encapsulin-associated ferritin-like protein [Persicimonas sp.]
MAEASTALHEAREDVAPDTLEYRRALLSLMEELEAIDWYQQRIDATDDDELAEILAHNRHEEREHAAMSLEWIRRRDPEFDRVLRTYLFTEEPIVDIEEDEEGESTGDLRPSDALDGSLGIGSLKVNVEQ